MRIGLVGPIPPPNGGMAMQTQQLQRLLGAEGIEVELLPTNAPYRPAWVARLRGMRALFRLLPYLWQVWRLAGRVDAIHLMANSGWSWQLFSAPVLWLGSLRTIPSINTIVVWTRSERPRITAQLALNSSRDCMK